MERDAASGASYFKHLLRTFQYCKFIRIADIGGQMLIAASEPQDALDFIAYITEASRLQTVSVDGELFASQRLLHKV